METGRLSRGPQGRNRPGDSEIRLAPPLQTRGQQLTHRFRVLPGREMPASPRLKWRRRVGNTLDVNGCPKAQSENISKLECVEQEFLRRTVSKENQTGLTIRGLVVLTNRWTTSNPSPPLKKNSEKGLCTPVLLLNFLLTSIDTMECPHSLYCIDMIVPGPVEGTRAGKASRAS